jgi:TRAP transporter TAXI family solute receptor
MLRVNTKLLVGAVAVALGLGTASTKAADFINVLTGGTSGVYYPLGVALSEIYAEKIPDVRVQVQSTKASVENLNLIQQGKGEIAFALGASGAPPMLACPMHCL